MGNKGKTYEEIHGAKEANRIKEILRKANIGKTYKRSIITKERIRLANIGKVISENTKQKISQTLLQKNQIKFEEKYKQDKNYKRYCERIDRLTKRQKEKLLYNWNGNCFYSKQFIKNQNKNDKHQIVIDHKISKLDGFINNISPEIMSGLPNLIFCTRKINSSKNGKSYYDGSLTIQKTIMGFYNGI